MSYRRNVAHQSMFQSLDPGHHHAAYALVLEAVQPDGELWKRPD